MSRCLAKRCPRHSLLFPTYRYTICNYLSSSRCYSATCHAFQQQAVPSDNPETGDGQPSIPPDFGLGSASNVRNYLREWNHKQEQIEKQLGYSKLAQQRNFVFPSSFFVRDAIEPVPDTEETGEFEQDASNEPSGAEVDMDEIIAHKHMHQLGDAFMMNTQKVRHQMVVYLGSLGPQSLFLTEHGRWIVDQHYASIKAHVVGNFITEKEIQTIKPFTPSKPVMIENASTGLREPIFTKGDVPFDACSSVLTKFKALQAENEAFRHQYAQKMETLYDSISDETLCNYFSLEDIANHHLHIKAEHMTNGAVIALSEKLSADERYVVTKNAAGVEFIVLPRSYVTAVRHVVAWSRAYQDAAARAAAGKDVTQDLLRNPLSNFITKARQLIARSRKVRPVAAEVLMGPTVEDARPDSGVVERRPTGVTFTDDEKRIILVLWHTFVRIPVTPPDATSRTRSVVSLILRAVGAYPDFILDNSVGRLFLQEIGCLDPWIIHHYHSLQFRFPGLGLNSETKKIEERAERAISQFKLPSDPFEPPFPDSMAHLRKDWGDLEAFVVDPLTTRLHDDAFSVDPAHEHPGCHWLHVHTAHPAAFIPYGHPLLDRAEHRNSGLYGTDGNNPMLPFNLLDRLTISNQRPSHVLTCSTCIAPDGSVKEIKLTPALLRNVIKIDIAKWMDAREVRPESNVLCVGPQRKIEKPTDLQQASLMDKYAEKFNLIDRLFEARWSDRKRKMPDHLRYRLDRVPHTNVVVKDLCPTDHSHERLFRSEFCYGDPAIIGVYPAADQNETIDDRSEHRNTIFNCGLLSRESVGAWAYERNVPVLYSNQHFWPGFSLAKLNNLQPHEPYMPPANMTATTPSLRHDVIVQQFCQASSPLRRFFDLMNQYQLNAHILGESREKSGNATEDVAFQYPRSREELLNSQRKNHNALLAVHYKQQKRVWTNLALFRAFYFGEHKLPPIWDVLMKNNLLAPGETKGKNRAWLVALSQIVQFKPTAEKFEDKAKFGQYLPVKLVSVNYREPYIVVEAIGPASDVPTVKSFAYPEFQNAAILQS